MCFYYFAVLSYCVYLYLGNSMLMSSIENKNAGTVYRPPFRFLGIHPETCNAGNLLLTVVADRLPRRLLLTSTPSRDSSLMVLEV